jgi:hypothetical protein
MKEIMPLLFGAELNNGHCYGSGATRKKKKS